MSGRVRTIRGDGVAASNGHYSQGAVGGGLLFVSGQLPDPVIGADAPFPAQVRSAMARLLAVLDATGGTPADLLKVNAYIVGVEHWTEFDGLYADLLGTATPARAVIPVPALHYGWLIEVEAVAVAPR